jgi:agmatine deiminase
MSSAHTPRELGYRMPAEWEPHAATWLTWPRPDGISFPGRYEPIPDIYARFIFHLTRHEEVHINVWNDALREEILETLRRHHVPLARVHLHPFQSYEPWCRDHGPQFVVRDRGGVRDRAVIDWGYNAWGGKYPPFDLDDQIPQHVAQFRGLPVFNPGIVMEGGSLDVNGCGTVLTTESCLLNENRNPELNRAQIETYLRDYLNVSKVLWLGDGIVGDDTDGHIDDLTRFVSADTVVTVVEPDPADENHAPLAENLRRLRTLTDQENRPLKIVELPMPRSMVVEDQRLPASYANFYIANGIVVVPTYRDPNDAIALERLRPLFPGREVIGLDSTDLVWGLGSFHCISQQEPA